MALVRLQTLLCASLTWISWSEEDRSKSFQLEAVMPHGNGSVNIDMFSPSVKDKTNPTSIVGRVGWELLSAFTTEEEQKGFPAPLAGTLGEVPGHLQNTSCWRAGECKQLSYDGETAVDVTQTKPACYWSGKTKHWCPSTARKNKHQSFAVGESARDRRLMMMTTITGWEKEGALNARWSLQPAAMVESVCL